MPKGVAVTHTGIADLVASHVERLAITPESRVLQFAPVDLRYVRREYVVGVAERCGGGDSHREQSLPGKELTDLLAREHVSHAKFTPSTLAALPVEELRGLTLVTGGEVCTAEIVDRYAAVATLVNEYGPTETTVDVTIARPVARGHGGSGDRVARCRGPRCLCWMGGCVRCPPGRSVSCMWRVAWWPVGIGGGLH